MSGPRVSVPTPAATRASASCARSRPALVVPVERAGDFPGTLALGAVSGSEGRARVRELVAEPGLVDGKDFVAVA